MTWLQEWSTTNWGWILLAVTATASVLNVVTSHYGEAHPKLKKALLFVLDLLAIVVSRGSSADPGKLGGLRVKLPIIQTSPQAAKSKTRAGVRLSGPLFLVLLIAGCSWQDGIRRGLDSASALAMYAPRAMALQCDAAKDGCIKAMDRTCEKLQKCDRDEKTIGRATVAAQGMALVGLSAVEVGDKPTAIKALAEAVKLLEPARTVLNAYGVVLP